MVKAISSSLISTPNCSINFYAAGCVSDAFKDCAIGCIGKLEDFSAKAQQAISELHNIIVLDNSETLLPSGFDETQKKLDKYASDAYGFVSRKDKAIVLNEQNHNRKDVSLEGTIESQAADTISHEIGHLIDKDFSTSDSFKEAYLKDLKSIEEKLLNGETQIGNQNLNEMLIYLKHYMEGADFSDGIDEKDITREGLRENFAECFSTIIDENPSEINSIYAELFPNTMKETLNFVI